MIPEHTHVEVPFLIEHSTQTTTQSRKHLKNESHLLWFQVSSYRMQFSDSWRLSGVKVTANQFRCSSESSQPYGVSLTGQKKFLPSGSCFSDAWGQPFCQSSQMIVLCWQTPWKFGRVQTRYALHSSSPHGNLQSRIGDRDTRVSVDGFSLDDNWVRNKKKPHMTTKYYSFVLDKLEHFESDVSVVQSVQITDQRAKRGAQLLQLKETGVTSLRTVITITVLHSVCTCLHCKVVCIVDQCLQCMLHVLAAARQIERLSKFPAIFRSVSLFSGFTRSHIFGRKTTPILSILVCESLRHSRDVLSRGPEFVDVLVHFEVSSCPYAIVVKLQRERRILMAETFQRAKYY